MVTEITLRCDGCKQIIPKWQARVEIHRNDNEVRTLQADWYWSCFEQAREFIRENGDD